MLRIEIKDSESSGYLQLKDILQVLPAEAKHLVWSILDLEATGDLGEGKNMLDLENTIKTSPSGLRMNWDELVILAHSVFQVINTTMVGVKPGSPFPRFVEDEIEALSEVVIEMIDSSVWVISVRDEAVLRSIERSFRETSVIT